MIDVREISRRQFLERAVKMGLGALGGATLFSSLSCASVSKVPSASEPVSLSPHMREAMYYLPSARGKVVTCQLCPNRCAISEGNRGTCGVRENRGGKLYTLVYGNPCAVHADPIEKKPFFHFLPGTLAFSIATAGCNLHCLYCQNWSISQALPEETKNEDLPPEKVAAEAERDHCASIAYTYSEPIIFYGYMLETAKLAKGKGIRNTVVSAGYINPAPLRELCQVVDAFKIDFKAFSESFYEEVCAATLAPVLETLKIIREEGIHLEIVNLVVPTLNDDEGELRELARWILDNLGPNVPTHFTRFFPKYKLGELPPTPVETLERARAIALEEGIDYAYLGNVSGHPEESTYCAHCGKLIIDRTGFAVIANHILDGKCKYCGNPIPGLWE